MLNDVGQFVRKEFFTARRAWSILPPTESDVTANRVCAGVDGSRGFGGAGVGMDSYMVEFLTKATFHVEPGGVVKWLSTSAKSILDNCRCGMIAGLLKGLENGVESAVLSARRRRVLARTGADHL